MLINLPDMGFSSSNNIYQPDRFFFNIKESIIKCIYNQNITPGAQFESTGKQRQAISLGSDQFFSTGITMSNQQASTNLRSTSPSMPSFGDFNKGLSTIEVNTAGGKLAPQARELYLEMRSKLMNQSERFFSENSIPLFKTDNFKQNEHKYISKRMDPNMPVINFELFKTWLDVYPFIRSLIRESLCPRAWTLKPIHAIKPSVNTDYTIIEYAQPSPIRKSSMNNAKRLAKYSNSAHREKEGEEDE